MCMQMTEPLKLNVLLHQDPTVYKTIDEIPTDLQHAFVAIEDERFYEHNGIDIKGIVRAGVSLISRWYPQ